MHDRTERMERIALALESMVPIAWMDRATAVCANPSRPTVKELWPSAEEREDVVSVLVMADTLAAGGPSEQNGESLSAVARALLMLSLASGGVTAFGRKWETIEEDGVARLTIEKK